MSKSRKGFRRNPPFREPASRILVVTEGTKTEPIYFKALLRRLRLSNRLVVVVSAIGSDPLTIVETANRKLQENTENHKPGFEQTWLVFDTESNRVHLHEATQRAKGKGYKLAISAPCIEYWFLLHFTYTTRYMTKCDEALDELRKHIEYDKGAFNANEVIEQTNQAIINARLIRQNQTNTNTEFPRTDVDLLVDQLNSLADKNDRLFDENG